MKWAPPLLLALCLLRLWIMPLGSSFWVDETGTAFVVHYGADHPSFAAAPQVPQSIYYALPALAERCFGFSELVYRLPSLIAMLAALWIFARLAARLIHPEAAWFAVFAWFALRGINYQAADARPYALGTLLACAALWFLLRWLDSAAWTWALAFVVSAALLWRVHLLFWPFYIVFACAFLSRARQQAVVPLWHVAVVSLLVAAALVPTAIRALALSHEAAAHVTIPPPNLRDLLVSLKLGLVIVCGAGAWVAAGLFRWPRAKLSISRSAILLVLAWWLCQPVLLFAYSRLTGNSVFLARYLSLSLPGGVLAAMLAAAPFLPAAYWTRAGILLGLGALASNGQWNHVWPEHHNSDWRQAASTVRSLEHQSEIPVVCPSPYVEARPPVWQPDYPLPGFLYSHLDVYPISAKPLLFPFDDSAAAETFAQECVRGTLLSSGRFLIYGGAGQAGFWRDWFAARPELASWHINRLGPFGDVEVWEFQK